MQPFVLITQSGRTTTYTGSLQRCYTLDDIPDHSVSMLPFCQVKEKWYDYQWDDLPILVLTYEDKQVVDTSTDIQTLPTDSVNPWWVTSDMDDDQFAELVSSVIDEIRNGEWCNFVVSRMFQVSFETCTHEHL
jgi:phenazine biosynthesis protein phzE